MRLKTPSKGAFRNIGAAVAHWASVEPSVASETWYPESQTCIAAHPSRRPLRGLLRMRSNLLKHNNLMLRSELRERLEAWATSDSPISHSEYQRRNSIRHLVRAITAAETNDVRDSCRKHPWPIRTIITTILTRTAMPGTATHRTVSASRSPSALRSIQCSSPPR